MITETTAMQTTAIYSDDKTHRYLLRKEWNSEKKSAEIIMLYPSSADTVTVDHTTMFVLRNLERLNYGSVNIVNLFSSMSGKHITSDIDEDNLGYIQQYADSSDIIIFATGTGGDGNKAVLTMQKKVLDMLEPYASKLYCIADQKGRKFYHPLCPAVRYWTLATFDYKELKAYQEEKAKPKEIAPVKPDEDTSVPETIVDIPVEEPTPEKPKRRKKNTKTTS